MLRHRIARVLFLGLFLGSVGCGFFRDRDGCRQGILTGRLRPNQATVISSGIPNANCDCNSSMPVSGPILEPGVIPPNNILPNPSIPQIKEGSGQQKEYDPKMSSRTSKIPGEVRFPIGN